MDSAAAVSEPREGVEAVYRADAERLWRAVYAFAGDAEVASDAVAEAFAQVLNRGRTDRTEMAAWSPDGRRIAYVSGKVGDFPQLVDGGIDVMNADGSGALKLADTNVAYVPPVWSPDGRWLAYRKDSSTTEWWIVPAAGGEPRPSGRYGGVAW